MERIQNVKPKEWNGINFRSTLEVETAQALTALGIPYKYETRRIVLQEGFRSPYQKDKVIRITYKPDFKVGPIMLECKGFETPEWRIKKKLVLKYLMEHEPDTIFCQTHDSKKDLLKALDKYWKALGFVVTVCSKPSKKKASECFRYDSISQAMDSLGLTGKNWGPIMSSLTGEREWVYNYHWQLTRITL